MLNVKLRARAASQHGVGATRSQHRTVGSGELPSDVVAELVLHEFERQLFLFAFDFDFSPFNAGDRTGSLLIHGFAIGFGKGDVDGISAERNL